MATTAIAPVSFSPAVQEVPAEAFAGLVARYQSRLYRIALRQLGNVEDAQDALQEALLLAYRHLSQFQGRADIATWLTRIVINAARGHQRRQRSRPTVSLEALTEAGREFSDFRLGPEARCWENERRERLEQLLQRLSPPLRRAIEAYEIDGLSCREAAARLGIKPATLKCRLFRGRRRLAALEARPPRAQAENKAKSRWSARPRRASSGPAKPPVPFAPAWGSAGRGSEPMPIGA